MFNIFFQKISDFDLDFWFMVLNDILIVFNIVWIDFLIYDYNILVWIVDVIVKVLDDINGEVQGQVIKCIGFMVQKIIDQFYIFMMEKLVILKFKNLQDILILFFVMWVMVVVFFCFVFGVFNNQVFEVYLVISKVLILRFIGCSGFMLGLLVIENEFFDYVDVLIEVVKFFGFMFQIYEIEVIYNLIVIFMENEKGNFVFKKWVVVVIFMFVYYLVDDYLV